MPEVITTTTKESTKSINKYLDLGKIVKTE